MALIPTSNDTFKQFGAALGPPSVHVCLDSQATYHLQPAAPCQKMDVDDHNLYLVSPAPSRPLRPPGYHGWPNEFCEHGRETFPGWHRAYLVEFERTLQVGLVPYAVLEPS